MSKVAEYRYAKSKGENEKQVNIHIREMVEMIKNEEVKENLYAKNIKVSHHAYVRLKEHYDADNLAKATKVARDMLSHASRIGTVLSYDGRINVLYAYRQTAFFLSPDLKTLVTVNKYPVVTYRQLLHKVREGVDREYLLELHFNLLREFEAREQEQSKKILMIEQRVRETTAQCVSMLGLVRGGGRKSGIKRIISEYNHQLKFEGKKLFELKIEKRHLCKSLVALY